MAKQHSGRGVGPHRRYEDSFKREAIRLVVEEKRPTAEVERNLGIPGSLLYKWVRASTAHPIDPFPGIGHRTKDPRDVQIRKLQKDLANAQEERDILKKAIAVFSRTPKENSGS
jgi:transposase